MSVFVFLFMALFSEDSLCMVNNTAIQCLCQEKSIDTYTTIMLTEIMDKKRIPYNTTLDADLLKKLKFLSVETDKRHNDLLEEAIADLLKKYKSPDHGPVNR